MKVCIWRYVISDVVLNVLKMNGWILLLVWLSLLRNCQTVIPSALWTVSRSWEQGRTGLGSSALLLTLVTVEFWSFNYYSVLWYVKAVQIKTTVRDFSICILFHNGSIFFLPFFKEQIFWCVKHLMNPLNKVCSTLWLAINRVEFWGLFILINW